MMSFSKGRNLIDLNKSNTFINKDNYNNKNKDDDNEN